MRDPEINVAIFAAHAPATDPKGLEAFARRLAEDVRGPLEEASGARWVFHLEDANRLSSDDAHSPADFLDEASLRMVEGPFDLVIVVTDVALTSRRRHVVAGLASPIARIAVLSTRKLLMAPRGKPMRALDAEAVRWNAAVLVLHLIGHLVGLDHAREAGNVMSPFWFEEDRRGLVGFSAGARRRLRRHADEVPERELLGGGFLRTLGFHLSSGLRHPVQVLRAVLRSRAPLLPLSLPGLATAAVTPTFILVFTAEIWDVGLNMPGGIAWIFAAVSIVAASIFLPSVQNLFFPRKDRRVYTEHMAVVNVSIFLVMLLAMVGLFLMVGLLMLFIEIYIFPPGLMATWPTLEDPEVTTWDKIRLAAFMSTVGVLTGALAGGLESRNLIRHLALFQDEP